MSKDSFKDRFWDYLEMVDAGFRELSSYKDKRDYINNLTHLEMLELISDVMDEENDE